MLNLSTNTITANISDNAATATKLANACTLTIGSTYGKGDNEQALLSNGSIVYWGTVSAGSNYFASNGLTLSGTNFSISYGTSAAALRTSSAGSATTVSRSDHVHALPALTSCTGTSIAAKCGTGFTSKSGARANLGITSGASLSPLVLMEIFSSCIKE